MSPNRTRRSKEDIIAEVIRNTVPGVTKTRIMNKANLNFKQVNAYIGFLCSNGFLRREETSGTYNATPKGVSYVEKYDEYAKAREAARSRSAAIRDILSDSR